MSLRKISCLCTVSALLLGVALWTQPAQAESLVWAKHYGGTTGTAVVLSDGGAIDTAGNVYTVGEFAGTVDFDPGPGTFNLTAAESEGGELDIFVSKLDAQGDFVWARQLGSVFGGFYEYTFDVAVDSSGNVYIVGEFEDTMDFDPGPGTLNLIPSGITDGFVWKLDTNGDLVWARQIGEGANGVAFDAAGNVHITGYFRDTEDFDPGPGVFNLTAVAFGDAYVWKLDPDGDFIWAAAVGGAFADTGGSIDVDALGNVYTLGSFQETADFDPGPGVSNLTAVGSRDVFLWKLDVNGDFVQAGHFGGELWDRAIGLELDADGAVYCAGRFQDVADLDPGPANTLVASAGDDDVFVAKVDVSGNLVWVRTLGNELSDFADEMTLDVNANVYVGGRFQGEVDFDPGPGIFNLKSDGASSDAFLWKLDTDGDPVWAFRTGGPGYDTVSGLTVDAEGQVRAVGSFQQTVDFDPRAAVFDLTASGLLDGFAWRLGQVPTIVFIDPTTIEVNPTDEGCFCTKIACHCIQVHAGDEEDMVDRDDNGEPDNDYGPCQFDPDPSDYFFPVPAVPDAGKTRVFLACDVDPDGSLDCGRTSSNQLRQPSATCP